MKITDYKTKEECNCWTTSDPMTRQTLPAGIFVKPLDVYYLPQHIKESLAYKWYDSTKDVFVYCSVGIVVLAQKNICAV